ncbi:MAG TPA: YfiR family protein [Verrucomicrobiae bacterium]|nr:YfiR family protein [Verrucomicrobiae bacterium]
MHKPDSKALKRRTGKLSRLAMACLGFMVSLLGPASGFGGEPPLTQYQVEAVFLFNFAKYVDWPPAAFTNATAPITIGVLGTDPFGDSLQHVAEGKTINGRPVTIRHLVSDSELGGCQILYISSSENFRVGQILGKAGALPILTVGESELFVANGGIINFVLKGGKVRLEINLAPAKKNGLDISSHLLAVADVVRGKSD